MIIDFTTKQPLVDGAAPTPVDTSKAILDNEANRRLMLEQPDYSFHRCSHLHMSIDDVQRTVKCADCKIWLDPVWCLRELFYYYERRVDSRLAAIKEFERKEAEIKKRKETRKERPREYLRQRRAESLERAAYNEYQAKLLTIRAERQKATAAKLAVELAESMDAVDPHLQSEGTPSTREKVSSSSSSERGGAAPPPEQP